MRKAALCVGLNHFALPGNDLAGCVPDAHMMADMLRTSGTYLLTDEKATKAGVLAIMTELVGRAKAGELDYLGISWSGHGTHYPQAAEADGLGEALVCYDIREKNGEWDPDTLIKDVEWKGLLNQVPKSCLVECWLDTCHSGGMDRLLLAGAYAKRRVQTGKFMHAPDNKYQMRMANSTINSGLNPNVVMWAACSEAQTAADAYIAGGSHGAFTYYWHREWLKDLRQSRVELLVKTRAALVSARYSQTPRLKAWNAEAQRAVGQ